MPLLQQQAILQAIQTSGCPLTDVACICKNTDFVDKLVAQIPELCSAEDSVLTADGSKAICIAYGVELDLPNLPGSSNSTSTAATTSNAESTTPASTATSATGVTETSTNTESSSSASESTASTSSSPTETAGTTTESSAAQETNNGAMVNNAGLSTMIAVALLGVAALS
ncbi:hypothetical protein RBB50_004348 [Rhinocladiella similis]